jgi:phage RecT family recombinase
MTVTEGSSTSAELAVAAAAAGGGASQRKGLGQLIEQALPEIEKALPPGIMEPDRFARIVLTELRKTPKLLLCTPESFMGALFQTAQLGLEPGGQLGHAFLIPYENRKEGTTECQLQVGYKGYIELAGRRDILIRAREVREGDDFAFDLGSNEFLHHTWKMGEERGEVIGFYGKVVMPDGKIAFHVMEIPEINKRRDRSSAVQFAKGKDWVKTPWDTDYDAMARKGLALDTPIPTPSGWTSMGLLEPGDEVFDMEGQVCRVRAVSEVKHLPCYRVTFANGSSVVCDHEHYWVSRFDKQAHSRSPWKVVQVQDMAAAKSDGRVVTVPVTEPLALPEAPLPIDPWTLGFWLGDGHSLHANVTVHEDEVDIVSSNIAAAGYEIGTVRPDPRSRAVTVGIKKGFHKALSESGLYGDKHVPVQYLRGSETQRLALLRGLMDSDGFIRRDRGRAIFANTNPLLTDAVAELARSLGETVVQSSRKTSGFGKTVTSYEVAWQPTVDPFTIPKKSARFRERVVSPYRGVASVEPTPSVPTRCISVDSPTKTFLAGGDMVPTHNTVVRAMVPQIALAPELQIALRADEAVVKRGVTGDLSYLYRDAVDASASIASTAGATLTEVTEALNGITDSHQRIACSKYLVDNFGTMDTVTADMAPAMLKIVTEWPAAIQPKPTAQPEQQPQPTSDGELGPAVTEILNDLDDELAEEATKRVGLFMVANPAASDDTIALDLERWLNSDPEDLGVQTDLLNAVTPEQQTLVSDDPGPQDPQESAGGVPQEVLDRVSGAVNTWDVETVRTKLREWGESTRGGEPTLRLRLIQKLAPEVARENPAATDLF